MTAEAVGQTAAEELCQELRQNVCADKHLQDQVWHVSCDYRGDSSTMGSVIMLLASVTRVKRRVENELCH